MKKKKITFSLKQTRDIDISISPERVLSELKQSWIEQVSPGFSVSALGDCWRKGDPHYAEVKPFTTEDREVYEAFQRLERFFSLKEEV